MGETKIFDIAIIGLGPAGAIFAKLLNEKFSVIAFDKKCSDKNDGFKKACGGLLAPDAQKMLAKLGLVLPTEVLAEPQIFSIKTIDLNTKVTGLYQKYYMNLDRYKFDMWLKSMISDNVTIQENSICTNIEPDGESYNITVLQNGEKQTFKAKYIVGADGASSIVRKKLFPSNKIPANLAIQQWFDLDKTSPYYSCIFDSDISDCYAWGIPKGDKFILGGAYSPTGANKKFEILKDKLKSFGYELNEPLKTEACMIIRPSRPCQFCCGENNVFLIGEAAGLLAQALWKELVMLFKADLY